jgi:glycine dehydrogenase
MSQAATTDPASTASAGEEAEPFPPRHLGPREADVRAMLEATGCASLDELIDATLPADIRLRRPLDLPAGRSEREALEALRALAAGNRLFRSYIGQGYYGTFTPTVIQRNVLENPGWYTAYTPYQAEVSQGRLEALLNFQTMVSDLTGLPLANASLLDEATAAAEAMHLCHALAPERRGFFVDEGCHPQTIAVVRTRAESGGLVLHVGRAEAADSAAQGLCGLLVQYPTTDGAVRDHSSLIRRVHEGGARVVVATDLLALTLLRPPGEMGADVAVGSSQRFGVPMGFGGPHAAFLAAGEASRRHVPGRIIGVSKDAEGRPACRMALQTREQHIRREKATSNICTAQVLLAVMAGLFAAWHGPEGLLRIARRVHGLTARLAAALRRLGFDLGEEPFFDTLRVRTDRAAGKDVLARARERGMNLRAYEDGSVGISLDETVTLPDVVDLVGAFAGGPAPSALAHLEDEAAGVLPADLVRTAPFLTHPVFNRYQSEHEMLRYLKRLESRDLSLTWSMIPLGSCTMKLNAAAEMAPLSWPEFAALHPFAPSDQAGGYAALARDLEAWLGEIAGFPAVSLQPNAGSQGEYAGLLAIRAFHASRGDGARDVCLIPVSAHGTNPASAVTAGYRVVAVACDARGNIDLDDLEARAEANCDRLGALMVTYPSTHGVFEEEIRRACQIVHARGGQVYLDGANLNALVGLARPGDIGADVCHINLHKTFCIPHGGGGPGMGPIGVAAHLAPFLPGHPLAAGRREGAVAAAPLGSPSILTISWMYVALMGAAGLKRATEIAILNANYMAARLAGHYEVLYTGARGRVAHEFIVDCRAFKKTAEVEAEDIAKRLMDFGFHAPTMSFPVPGTLMIEPTESESKEELDRFCDAMIRIREEIRAVEEGRADRRDNPLKRAPHTVAAVTATAWDRPYSREQAAFPAPWVRERKFWPAVARIDNAYGDRNLVCLCPPVEDYAERD